MKIAICDDDQRIGSQVEQYIRRYCEETALADVEILRYENPTELLENYPKNLDLLLLDIEMPGINGIETAREIRGFDEQVILIFMTNYAKYAIEGYSVHAYNYLLKPILYEAFCQELNSVFALIQERRGIVYSFNCREGYRTFAENEIEMIETQGKNVIVHAGGQQYLVYRSMKSMESLPGRKLFRIHTAYMISMDAVVRIGKDSVFLRSGKELPISRHRKKEFLNNYMEYIGGLL